MDASASPKNDADYNNVYGFYLKIENSFPTPTKQRSTVIKYTKLPEFEYDRKVSWPQDNYTLQPRLRRIIPLDDQELKTTRSLKPDLSCVPKMAASITKRKIVTITEDDENDLHPKFSKDTKKQNSIKKLNRSVGPDFKEERQCTPKTTSRLTSSSKYSKDSKPSAKMNIVYNRKETGVPHQNHREKQTNVSSISTEYTRPRNVRDKDMSRKRSENTTSRISVSKNLISPNESAKELMLINTKLLETSKPKNIYKKTERTQSSKSPPPGSRSKFTFLKEIQSKNKPITVIHVPLDEKYQKRHSETEGNIISADKMRYSGKAQKKADCGNGINVIMNLRDVSIGTDPPPKTTDQFTEIVNIDNGRVYKCVQTSDAQTEMIKDTFDSLEIPNVTLTKDKIEPKRENSNVQSRSLPNLQVPLKVSQCNEDKSARDGFCNSASYVIRQATYTYTTRQKINIHVVSSSDDASPNQSPSPITYPVNVVSVFKKEMKKQKELIKASPADDGSSKKNQKRGLKNVENTKYFNEMKSLNCSYVFNSNKLMKPSEVISAIGVNNSILQSDYICEQFQRELNFIDSFFESLQYLESCSLSEKCFADNKVGLGNNPVLFESGFRTKNSEYGTLLSKFDNSANVDNTETMASKSLSLLNLLIRDEQRRAKNLLFVLKMREDALKDFTKSQILWLENKKKHENTDISTLKKKQRGALLKLQHECGEMQRMRKALLTLSEKRKLALMRTKKNIELKLNNNVDVEQIILGKKKLKRSTPTADRNTAPLKCFDLSSSGCDESTTSRPNSEAAVLTPEVPIAISSVRNAAIVHSAEKSIQTGESVFETVLVERSTDTAAENFVVVDGGYLNILFHNLSLPQIFSSGKQYEVNEEALKNIVSSANSHHSHMDGSEVVEKLMDQIKNRDADRSSSPSTARSLVEEFDQYYKSLADEDKSPIASPDREFNDDCVVYELKDTLVQATESKIEEDPDSPSHLSASTMTSDSSDTIVDSVNVDQSCTCDAMCLESMIKEEPVVGRQAGPLPVPAGACDVPEPVSTIDVPTWSPSKTSPTPSLSDSSVSTDPHCPSVSSMSSLTTTAHCEAEELRRQQLAIEREIKALEQQQCRLLVVREIPDKPPPPYTPPIDSRAPKPPRMFLPDETTDEKIQKQITDPMTEAFDSTDVFDSFVRDFCQESLERQRSEQSDKPWHACNLLPQKAPLDSEKLVLRTSSEMVEVLTGVSPTVVSGVGARRSDHIDDILFAEWRRCEPEWTSLHTDEAIVKNQIFESIFQKILTETIDEYKRTVQCNVTDST